MYKKQISRKLFLMLVIIIASATATVLAQDVKQRNFRDQFNRTVREKMQIEKAAAAERSLSVRKSDDKTDEEKARAELRTKLDNFNLGVDLVLAKLDAGMLDDYEEATSYVIVDLVYLIDRLEGQPEAAELQKILKAVVRKTAGAEKVQKDIEAVTVSYIKRQTAEEQWYLNAGVTTVEIYYATYMVENEGIKAGLKKLQALIKDAPKDTPPVMLEPMKVLSEFAGLSEFTEMEYFGILESIGNLVDATAAV